MGTLDPLDERRHTPDDVELWNESYYLDWFSEDLSLGGYVRIGFYPNLHRVWYWACLVGPDRPLVTVIQNDVALPRSETSLELRHDGLWADHVVETPVEHMSINLEAFGLQVEDPSEVYRAEPRGERVPFGLELDFHTDRAAYLWPAITPRYEIPCRVHGEIMVGSERIEFDGWVSGTIPGELPATGGRWAGPGPRDGSTTAPVGTPRAASSATTTGASATSCPLVRRTSSSRDSVRVAADEGPHTLPDRNPHHVR